MQGILFDDKTVNLDPRAFESGGSWAGWTKGTAWETDTIKRFWEWSLRYKTLTMLDVGASTGSYCLLPVYHDGMDVIAFEASLSIYDILVSNVELNKLGGRVSTIHSAVCDIDGAVALKIPERASDSGLATIGRPVRFTAGNSVHVMSLALDTFLAAKNILPQMLKIDVEGAEMLVLKGGEEYIKQARPDILCECAAANNPQFDHTAMDTVDLLVSWGACYEQWDGDNIFFWWD